MDKIFEDGEVLYAEDLNVLNNELNILNQSFMTDVTYRWTDKKQEAEREALDGFYNTKNADIITGTLAQQGSHTAWRVKIPEFAVSVKIKWLYVYTSGRLIVAWYNDAGECVDYQWDSAGKYYNTTTAWYGEFEEWEFEIPYGATELRYHTMQKNAAKSMTLFSYELVKKEFGVSNEMLTSKSISYSKLDDEMSDIIGALTYDEVKEPYYTYKGSYEVIDGKFIGTNLSKTDERIKIMDYAAGTLCICTIPLPEGTKRIKLANFVQTSGTGYVAVILTSTGTLVNLETPIIQTVKDPDHTYYTYKAGEYFSVEIPDGCTHIVYTIPLAQKGKVDMLYSLGNVVTHKIGIGTDSIQNGAITQDKLADGISLGGASFSETLTVNNSDKIAIIGDSYTESAYAQVGKSYIAKLSLFSDFVFMNYGKSGDIYAGRLSDIRTNKSRFGTLAFKDWNIKYACCCCYINDQGAVRLLDLYLKSLENLMNVLKGIGCEPIILSEWTMSGSAAKLLQVKARLTKLAEEYHTLFWNIADYVMLIQGTNYTPFWGNGHPATRTNNLESDAYEKYLDKFERPLKALKIFRYRNPDIDCSSIVLDNLMFSTNEERAKLFKEISVGANSLSTILHTDNLNQADQVLAVEYNEYDKIMTGTEVELNSVNLISAVLPYTALHLSNVALEIGTDLEIDVYVKNAMASPFPNVTRFSSFYVDPSYEGTIALNTKLVCSDDGATYTVAKTYMDDFGNYHIYCSPEVREFNATGTLTDPDGRVIPYTFRERGVAAESINDDTCGHWTKVVQNTKEIIKEVEGVEEIIVKKIFDISEYIQNGGIFYDTAHFLIVSKNSENIILKSVAVNYTGDNNQKHINRGQYKFSTNYASKYTELLPTDANIFSSLTTPTTWGLTAHKSYEQDRGTKSLPRGTQYVMTVTDTLIASYTVPASLLAIGRTYRLEIWARFFPPVYTDGSDGLMTLWSYDWNDLYIKFSNAAADDYITRFRVGTHWKILQYELPTSYTSVENIPINIYSNSKGIEIAYISLKEI